MDHREILLGLFKEWSGNDKMEIARLPQAGSDRLYYRISAGEKTAIGVYSSDINESEAFLYFTNHFEKNGIQVPHVISSDLKSGCYLISDLGNKALFDYLEPNGLNTLLTDETKQLYQKAIAALPCIQVKAAEGMDFSKCYPSSTFDSRAMKWDLNYFKYYFLRLLKIPFNEVRLEDDFETLIDFLLQAESGFFMYRDFQARNIMIHHNEPWFIDYQGGRRGPLQYDLASILFQVKANLPYDFRDEMLQWYIENLKKYKEVDVKSFGEYYFGFVLLRLLQVMGAYGFRGYYERKSHFLKSIPYAISSLRWLLKNHTFKPEMPELMLALTRLTEMEVEIPEHNDLNYLCVEVNSFSFKNGPPPDYSGNGGGYVFDCRSLHNPGRYHAYKHLSGMDEEVISFLAKEKSIEYFFQNVCNLVDESVSTYIQRGFTHLQINFGCTGGQHRSVYMTEKLAGYLRQKYDIKVIVTHCEKNNWNP